jgi:hypothetical protein
MKANHENNEKRNGVSMAWHQSAEGNVFNQWKLIIVNEAEEMCVRMRREM